MKISESIDLIMYVTDSNYYDLEKSKLQSDTEVKYYLIN